MFQALERAGCFPLIPTPGTWVCSSGPLLINYSLKYVKIKRYSLHTSQQAIFWDCSGTNDLIQIDIVCVLVWADTQIILAQGSSENLVIGSGGGQFGLWFDADLNKGRTQRCDTFANPPSHPPPTSACTAWSAGPSSPAPEASRDTAAHLDLCLRDNSRE